MEKHRGEIVEDAIRKSGFSLKKLSERLGISRNTLYNRFRDPQLSYEFIIAVGNIIHYNFSLDFAELRSETNEVRESPINYIERDASELLKLKKKYTDLLERYNKLLAILVRLANANELHTVKKEILRFLEDNTI
jgi:transcriptional regulator with XRE-family HTH domain